MIFYLSHVRFHPMLFLLMHSPRGQHVPVWFFAWVLASLRIESARVFKPNTSHFLGHTYESIYLPSMVVRIFGGVVVVPEIAEHHDVKDAQASKQNPHHVLSLDPTTQWAKQLRVGRPHMNIDIPLPAAVNCS